MKYYLLNKKIYRIGIKTFLVLTVSLLLSCFLSFNEKEIVQGQEKTEQWDCHTEIRIGEAVDETKEYGDDLLIKYKDLYDNAVLAKDEGFSAVDNAILLIENIAKTTNSARKEANKILGFTDGSPNNCEDCSGACLPGKCNCTKIWEFDLLESDVFNADGTPKRHGCKMCDNNDIDTTNDCPDDCFSGHLDCLPVFPWTCDWICDEPYYKCPNCENPCNCDIFTLLDGSKASCARWDGTDNACPMTDIDASIAAITGYYSNALTNYTNINNSYTNIQIHNLNITGDLLNVMTLTTSVTPTQISAKLDGARKELRQCFTPLTCYKQLVAGDGYCVVEGEIFTIKDTLNCSIIKYFLEIDKPRCSEEAADSAKAPNYFCCDLIY